MHVVTPAKRRVTSESPFKHQQLVLHTGELQGDNVEASSFAREEKDRRISDSKVGPADAPVRRMHPFHLRRAVSTLRNWHGKWRKNSPFDVEVAEPPVFSPFASKVKLNC